MIIFAFQHANLGQLFIQELDASNIDDLAKAVQQIFGDIWTNIIGTRYGEKLFMGKQWGLPIKKTEQLDAEGTIKKIMTTEYVQNALKGSKRQIVRTCEYSDAR